jgi:hypothetical protein
MNPMNALKYSQANVSLKDFSLPPVSPYSGKFIGYTIDQGTLHTELKYQVANDMSSTATISSLSINWRWANRSTAPMQLTCPSSSVWLC